MESMCQVHVLVFIANQSMGGSRLFCCVLPPSLLKPDTSTGKSLTRKTELVALRTPGSGSLQYRSSGLYPRCRFSSKLQLIIEKQKTSAHIHIRQSKVHIYFASLYFLGSLVFCNMKCIPTIIFCKKMT